MSELPATPGPSEKGERGRDWIAIAVSLIGAGAGLNNWFPALQAIGLLLVLGGVLLLAVAAWQIAGPIVSSRLGIRSRRLAGGVLVALAGTALLGTQMLPRQSGLLSVSAPDPPAPTALAVSLLDLLPDDGDLQVDLVEHETGKRSGEALARLRSGNADEMMQRLIEWGFVENAFRNFGRPPGATPTPQTLYLLEVSIHRVGGVRAATEMLRWFADDRAELSGLPPTPIEPIGEESRALAGDQENDIGATSYREATVYTRKGSLVVRVTTRSQQANPLPFAIAMAKLVVDKAPG